ncbi:ComEA family DNA-binding protein [Niabella aquatica]
MAFFILLLAIIMVTALPFVLPEHSRRMEAPGSDTAWMAMANELQQRPGGQSFSSRIKENEDNSIFLSFNKDHTRPVGTLFYFDPNTLDAAGFAKLGLRDRTIKTLLNYRNKGGRFRKTEDLAKIYGLRPDEFKRLEAYIKIGTAYDAPAPKSQDNTAYLRTSFPENKPKYGPKVIEINSADMAAFELLYGIGNKLAARIVHFREKLGGFHSIDQVGETYGLPDSTFQKIRPQLQVNQAPVRKININTASYNELNIHPYISNKTAFTILKYRKEKGLFSDMDEIKMLVSETGDSYDKIVPYLTIE